MLPYLGWLAFSSNVLGVAMLFSFGGPGNAERNRAERIVSQLGLLILLGGLGLQLAALLMRG